LENFGPIHAINAKALNAVTQHPQPNDKIEGDGLIASFSA
jgi:hypothetical protein